MRNLKKRGTKVQELIDAEVKRREDITDSEESEKDSQKTDNISVGAISKSDQKAQKDPKQLQGIAPFSIADDKPTSQNRKQFPSPNFSISSPSRRSTRPSRSP